MTNAVELFALLAETTVASSIAIVLVLLLRQPVRRMFGAAAGYSSWLLVPAALIAVLLPAMPVSPVPITTRLVLGDAGAQMLAAAADPVIGYALWLSIAWLLGVAAMTMRFVRHQHVFRRGLGVLHRRADGLHQAEAMAGLPAVIGMWRPCTVLPADFEKRYTPEQQVLLQTHERIHVVRGDLPVNAVVAALRCLFWFNPLVHVAARWFRHDQELACDQRVLATHPQSRRAYGEAMFSTQLAAQPLPLGCHWGFSHPLKERIEMLKQPVPSKTRWMIGSALILVLTAATGVAAWAAQPGTPAAGTPGAGGQLRTDMQPERNATPVLNPPRYPGEAVVQKLSGKVVLLIDIDAQGRPTAIEIERAEPAGMFEAEAASAAWKWMFNPAIENGQPVASRVRVPVEFKIPGPPVGANDGDA